MRFAIQRKTWGNCHSAVCDAEYVQLYVDWLINRGVYQQFAAFYHGFHSVCASNALIVSNWSCIFSSKELGVTSKLRELISGVVIIIKVIYKNDWSHSWRSILSAWDEETWTAYKEVSKARRRNNHADK